MIALSTTAPPLAHAGHWLANLLYLMPVFILAIGVVWQRRRDQQLRDAGESTPEEEVPFTDE